MLDGDLGAVMRAGQEFEWDRIPFILEDRFMKWLGETMGHTLFFKYRVAHHHHNYKGFGERLKSEDQTTIE